MNKKKSVIMTLNVTNPKAIQVDGQDLPMTDEFPYLGSTVRNDGGAVKDIKNRLGKARNAFTMLHCVWKSQQ